MNGEDESDGDDADEPFAGLLDEIDERREGNSDASEGVAGRTSIGTSARDEESVFTDESYEAVDTDELWDELGADDPAQETFEGGGPLEDEDTNVVPKRSFCQSCQYITGPPEFRCTHDGTDILEFVDTEHVRVRDCPIVRERREESEENL